MCSHIKDFSLSFIIKIILFNFLLNASAYDKIDSTEIFGSYNRLPSIENSKFHSNPDMNIKYSSKHDHGTENIHQLSSNNLSPSSSTVSSTSNKQSISSPDLSISHPLSNTQTARVPLYLYNPGLARQIGLNTLMYGGILYGLTVIPAILAAAGIGPFAGLLGSFGKKRRKRSVSEWNYELSLLNKLKLEQFFTFLERIMENQKINNNTCKKYHTCQVYQKAFTAKGHKITLNKFINALIKDLTKIRLVSEESKSYFNLLPKVKLYIDTALSALTGSNCTLLYPCKDGSKTTEIY